MNGVPRHKRISAFVGLVVLLLISHLIPASSEDLTPQLVGIKVNGKTTVEVVFNRALTGLDQIGQIEIEEITVQSSVYMATGTVSIADTALTGGNKVVRLTVYQPLENQLYRLKIPEQFIGQFDSYKLLFWGKTYNVENPHGYWNILEERCEMCHLNHQGKIGGLINTTNDNDVCLQCHNGQPGVPLISTLPGDSHMDNNTCSKCHDTHLPNFEKGGYLLSSKNSVTGEVYGARAQFCFNCHETVWKKYYDTDITPVTNRIEGRHSLLWEDGKAFSCLSCHSIHQGSVLDNSLCFRCHTNSTWNYPDALPYQGRAVYEAVIDSRPRHGGQMCSMCHQVHGSPNGILLEKPVNETCLGCHENYSYKILSDGNLVTKPLKNCLSCHNPHGSDPDHANAYLLNDDLNLRSGAVQLMRLSSGIEGKRNTCLGCHRAADEAKEKVVESVYMNPLSNLSGSQGQHLLEPVEVRSCLECHSTGNKFHS